ncbi:unnamed protein product [Trifolium pratense]|uniref:Uncharacterized protein n=1 Tax=Trifolium pratense TaxID=57577 RepID=A0ACB0LEV0_TRIPR|nr:unnamed protein product [Trifolium pratense]
MLRSNLPIIRIPGDGRCMFRSVVYGACLRTGDPPPSLTRQKELADELRAKVVDEFIKRRADTEWFLEGDFNTYTVQMRRSQAWGGEPELLMSSHVLQSMGRRSLLESFMMGLATMMYSSVRHDIIRITRSPNVVTLFL